MVRLAFAFTLLAGTALAQTPAPMPAPVPASVPERVRGTMVGLDGPMLTVRSRDDRLLQITLAEPIVVAAVVPAKLTDAKPGHMGYHVGKQGIAGNVKRYTQKQIRRALVQLTR